MSACSSTKVRVRGGSALSELAPFVALEVEGAVDDVATDVEGSFVLLVVSDGYVCASGAKLARGPTPAGAFIPCSSSYARASSTEISCSVTLTNALMTGEVPGKEYTFPFTYLLK